MPQTTRKYIRFHHLPWHSGSFISFISACYAFGWLTCLVLTAMAINGLVTLGTDYPRIVMAQEAIILTMAVLPSVSCTCSWGDDNYDGSPSWSIANLPIFRMVFALFAFIFRVATTGFYLKEQYSEYYSQPKRNVYALESGAALVIVLVYFLCIPFYFSFYAPLFKKRPDESEALADRLNYTAKQFTFMSILITVESWTENVHKDEESGDAAAAAAVRT